MRAVSALPSVGLALFLFGCNPPLPENEAPSIRVVEPVGRLDEDSGDTTYRANALNPLLLRLVLRDRDGDSPLDVRVYLDPTPETDGDAIETLEEVGSALAVEVGEVGDALEALYPGEDNRPELDRITEGALVDITLSEGLPEGAQALILVATDNQEVDATRELRMEFAVNASLSAPVVSVSPTSPRTGDPIVGTLVTPAIDPEGGEPYHEWRWTHTVTNEVAPPDAPGTGTTGTLGNDYTTRGDVWRFCFTAWDTGDGTEPSEAERASIPRVEGCQEVTIVNTPPGAPGAVGLDPAAASPAVPLLCSVTTGADDDDMDPATYTFAWTRNGSAVPGVTSEWLPAHLTAPNDEWTCTVTAQDTEIGGSQISPPVTIGVRQVALEDAVDNSLNGAEAGDRVGATLVATGIENLDGAVVSAPGRGVAKSYRGQALPDGIHIGNPGGIALTASAPSLGRALASADLDDDGRRELIVGAEGRTWVVFSDSVTGAVNLDTAAVATITSSDPEFGAVVAGGELRAASVGAEVVVATQSVTVPNVVRIFNGNGILPSASILDTNDAATITAAAVGDGFGSALAVGDLTGDDVGDLVVSDPVLDVVYVFPGDLLTGDLTPSTAGVITITGTAGDELGAALAVADFDGDGTDDLAIGAPGADTVGVFYGGPTFIGGAFTAADARVDGAAASRIGSAIGAYPDVTGLVGASLVLSAPDAPNGAAGVFLAETLTSSAGPIPFADAAAVFTGTGAGNDLFVPATFVNLDTDPIPDFMFGEPGQDGTPGADTGKVYFLLTAQ